MRLGSSSILGLAISDREISCAQVHLGSGRRSVQHVAQFALPAGASFDQPEALGKQLREFLRQHHITANRAVVGVPAKWLIAQEKDVPPAEESAAIAMLRLQAERLAIAESTQMVFDIAGKPDESKATRVLMLGMLQQQVERIQKLCAAAEIEPAAIMPTALALSHLLAGREDRTLVVLSRGGADVISHADGAPRMLRHFASGESAAGAGVSLTALGSTLRRALALAPSNGVASRELLLWQDMGLSPQDVSDLSERLGLAVKTGNTFGMLDAQLEAKALNGHVAGKTAEAFVPPVALALAARSAEATPVNFLDSRLKVEPARRFGQRTILGATVGVLVLATIAFLYINVQQLEQEAHAAETQLKTIEPDVKAAEARIDQVKYGRGFFEARPPVLDCLREITATTAAGNFAGALPSIASCWRCQIGSRRIRSFRTCS
jgi:hypothetical protein